MKSKLNIFFLGIVLLVSSCMSKEAKSVLDHNEEMQALYEQGTVQFEAGLYHSAVLSLTQAAEMAEKEEDQSYIGRINRELARSCEATSNYRDALNYMKKALKAFEAAGEEKEKSQAFLETGKLYYRLEDYNMANRVLKSSLILAKSQKDTLLEVQALESYSELELAKTERNPELVLKMLGRIEVLGQKMSPEAEAMMAYALSLGKDYKNACKWLKKAQEDVVGLNGADAEEAMMDIKFREYQVYSRMGDDRKALSALEYYTASSRKAQKEALSQSVAASQRTFFQQQSEKAQDQLDNLKLKVIVGLLLINLIVVFVYVFSRNKRMAIDNRLAEEKAENERLIGIAEELQSKIQTISQKNSGRKIQSVKMDVLERLCEQYYIYEGTENLQPKILKEVKSVVDGFRKDPKSVEDMLDANYDGLVADLRQEIPSLKEEDIRLFCFVAAGFSSTTVSTLIEKEKSVVYNRISRLKNKISSSDAQNKDRFLKMFEK